MIEGRNQHCRDLKVLVLTNIFPTAENPSSGTYVADQVRSLSNYVSTSVVYKRSKHRTGYFSFFLRVLYALLSRDYDLVHAHYGFHSAFLPSFFRAVPLVVTFHGDDAYTEFDRNLVYRFMGAKVISNSTYIIAVSSTVRNHLTNHLGADIRKTEVIPCGIDSAQFTPMPKSVSKERLGVRRSDRVVLFIGRLTYEKGVDLIREVAIHLKDIQFWFIGDGPIRWEAPNCRFFGEVPHNLISKYINAADTLVLPSRSEGTPITVLESLACETPVVCSRVGACPELIRDGLNGILIPPNDQRSLLDGLKRALFEKEFDTAAGRRTIVENYDLAIIAQRIFNVYTRAMEKLIKIDH